MMEYLTCFKCGLEFRCALGKKCEYWKYNTCNCEKCHPANKDTYDTRLKCYPCRIVIWYRKRKRIIAPEKVEFT